MSGTDNEAESLGAEVPAEVETSTPETEENETEIKAEGEEPDAPADEQEEEQPKPKRESGYDRMKRKNQYLQSEILRLKQAGETKPDDTDKPPREEDFNGDWGKFIAASAAYEAAKAVKGSLAEDRKSSQKTRMAELEAEVLADFEERAEAFKTKAKDFDQVVSKFVDGGGKFSDTVRELVTESDVGPQLAYHLAKNPGVANKLNSLSPLQAAKEIGRLEDTLSRPSNRATRAPAPIKGLSGGSAPAAGEDAQVSKMLKGIYG